jgi:hypothetical protein
MDPELRRIFGGEGRTFTITASLLVHGVVMTGTPSPPSRWGDDVNDLVRQQPPLPGADPLDLALLQEAPNDTDADQHGYGTLRNVHVELPSGRTAKVAFMRVDLEQVAAWWLRPMQ